MFLVILVFLFLIILLPPISTRTDTLFPYTTLVRSNLAFHSSQGRHHAGGARGLSALCPLEAGEGRRTDDACRPLRRVGGAGAVPPYRVRSWLWQIDLRQEQRRVGKECGSTSIPRWSPNH